MYILYMWFGGPVAYLHRRCGKNGLKLPEARSFTAPDRGLSVQVPKEKALKQYELLVAMQATVDQKDMDPGPYIDCYAQP